MEDQENCVRVTRLAKKRAAEATDASLGCQQEEEAPTTKKRMVLGELPNLSSNVQSTRNLDSQHTKPKSRTQKKKKKTTDKVSKAVTTATTTQEDIIYAKSEDPHLCGGYVSEIYEYLHNMEIKTILKFLKI